MGTIETSIINPEEKGTLLRLCPCLTLEDVIETNLWEAGVTARCVPALSGCSGDADVTFSSAQKRLATAFR